MEDLHKAGLVPYIMLIYVSQHRGNESACSIFMKTQLSNLIDIIAHSSLQVGNVELEKLDLLGPDRALVNLLRDIIRGNMVMLTSCLQSRRRRTQQ